MAIKSEETMFTKEQFLNSKSYRQYQDFLNAALDDKKTYTKKQVNEIINNFYKKGRNKTWH